MKRYAGLAALAALLAAQPLTAAEASEGDAALAEIGRLNGVALACQQPAISSRARNAVTQTAPKTRASGETFEQATQAAFLKQGKEVHCPTGPELAGQLENAEKRLTAAFPPVK